MARYKVVDVFVKKGQVFHLFENEKVEELFDQPELLRSWKYGEFGEKADDLCLEADLPYLEAKLRITREVIAEGKIMVGKIWVSWVSFDSQELHYEVRMVVRKEIERRMKKQGW